MLMHDSDAMHESGEAWIRVKRIKAGGPREPEEVAIPEPASRFETIECCVNVAESCVNDRQGDR